MEYNEALEKIHSIGNFSLPPTLERIKEVLSSLSNPQNNFPSIQIAGTNGKGSVAVMTAQILTEQGYKTGLFTSPYILDFRDRIRIDGEFIEKEKLGLLTEEVLNTGVELTEFELITAIAFLYFSREKCDIAVIETGLGGRLDATNALEDNLASVITKIGLDHTAVLGDTIEQIALEKCGIIKTGPTVTLCSQEPSALEIIKQKAKNLIIPDLKELEILKSDLSGNKFIYKGEVYETSLKGEFQIDNALAVIELFDNIDIAVSLENIKKGIKKAEHPARFETFMGGRIILDGAHNPDAAEVLSNQLKSIKNATAIVGMMKDKDCEAVLAKTLPYFSEVIAVGVEGQPRSLKAEELEAIAKKYCSNTSSEKDYKEALRKALSGDKNKTVVIFGSLYLASAIRPLLLDLK